VDFRNTVIIMTSNAGSHLLKNMTGAAESEVRAAVMAELDRAFRPEFLNRIDEIVLFHALTPEHIKQIVDIQLRNLQGLLAERRITLQLSDAAKDFLAERGYDPVYGARPLKRVIQRDLQDPLALAILEGRVLEGDHVYADVAAGGDRLDFSVIEDEAAFSPVAGR